MIKNPTKEAIGPPSEEMLHRLWKSKVLVPVLSIRSPPKEAIGGATMYIKRDWFYLQHRNP